MRAYLLLLISILALISCDSKSELVQLTVPDGFEGPAHAQPSAGAHVTAYVRKIPGEERGTLLQVSTYDFGAKLADVSQEELGNGAEHYLMEFLKGVERRRMMFKAGQPERIELDGKPAAKIEWQGISGGYSMSGTMYCVIVGTVVISFHSQTFEDAPVEDSQAAIQAIESVEFGAG